MSGNLFSGLDGAIKEILGGIFTTIIVSTVLSTGIISSYFIWYFHLLNIVGMIGLIQKMLYWATIYIVGWLVVVVVFMLANTGLLTIGDFLIYLLPLGVLVYRFKKRGYIFR